MAGKNHFLFDDDDDCEPPVAGNGAGSGPTRRRKRTIEERFAEYDADHPDVFALFRRFAEELRGAGHPRYSSDAILHRIRWHYATSGSDATGFKISNDYTAMYARKLIEVDPTFEGFFTLRERPSEVKPV